MKRFMACFSLLLDRRQPLKILHPLPSVLFVAVAACVAGCDDWDSVVTWAKVRLQYLRELVDLPYGVPSVSTFQRMFRMIDSEQLEKCFAEYMRGLDARLPAQSVPIDGKTLRGAKEDAGGRSLFHIVSAFAHQNGVTLAQVRTDAKSNEITAIPELLALLSIEGCVVTSDAEGAQTKIAEAIVERNHADYVLGLKANQPSMLRDAALFFAGVDTDKSGAAADALLKDAAADICSRVAPAMTAGCQPGTYELPGGNCAFAQSMDQGHGRVERRIAFLSRDACWMARAGEFRGLKSAGMIVTHSKSRKTGADSYDCRFFITTLTDVSRFMSAVREHWQCESVHWSLDVTFGEDACRSRKDSEPQNIALVRKIARNLLSQHRNTGPRPISFPKLRLMAMLDESFHKKVMLGII